MAYVIWSAEEKANTDAPQDYWPRITEAMDPKILERQVHWYALPVGWEQLDYPTFLERRRQRIARVVRVVREAFETLNAERPAYIPSTPADMIAAGESQTTEFKASARWNVYTQQADKSLRHNIVKAVCGFLNGEGANLFIGVADDAPTKTVIGLSRRGAPPAAEAVWVISPPAIASSRQAETTGVSARDRRGGGRHVVAAVMAGQF